MFEGSCSNSRNKSHTDHFLHIYCRSRMSLLLQFVSIIFRFISGCSHGENTSNIYCVVKMLTGNWDPTSSLNRLTSCHSASRARIMKTNNWGKLEIRDQINVQDPRFIFCYFTLNIWRQHLSCCYVRLKLLRVSNYLNVCR